MPVALVAFVTGDHRVVSVGEVVADDDPVMVGREHLFNFAPNDVGDVEQATAAPGERRQRRKLS
jgi:hypothetical protein